jgi:hypothetical protein
VRHTIGAGEGGGGRGVLPAFSHIRMGACVDIMAQYNSWRHDNSNEGIFKRVCCCGFADLLCLAFFHSVSEMSC